MRRLALLTLTTALACTPPGPANSSYDLEIGNATTISVAVAVNGPVVRVVPPRSQVRAPAGALPPLPWTIETRTTGGRVLSSLTVRAGDVWRHGDQWKGDAVRADLSCGRLDVWVGPPILGPVAVPGRDGGCDP